MKKIAGLARVIGLGAMLVAVPAFADPGAGDPAAQRAAAEMAGTIPQAAGADTGLVEFLQCRTGCGPQCETSGDSAQNEHCKQICERKCHELEIRR
jgi:hypothetical protein